MCDCGCPCYTDLLISCIRPGYYKPEDKVMIKPEDEDYAILRQTLINMLYFRYYHMLPGNNHPWIDEKKSREQLRQEATEEVDADLADPNFN